MSRHALTPDHLFDRPWRPGRRFAHGAGHLRKFTMLVLLALLCAIIGGYAYITDSGRVRAMAQSYLSSHVKGPVEIDGATLSVFEGLRLDNVRVYVDDAHAPDSLLFSAQTLLIKYDPRTMLAGRLEATQIVAQKPQVFLAEDRTAGEWNFHRLMRRRGPEKMPTPMKPGHAIPVPEILLRNARVTISEYKSGREVASGRLTIDGRLAPTGDGDLLAFHLQSRGDSAGFRPYASGAVSPSTGHVDAQLMKFVLGGDFRSLLPIEPREWCQRHEFDGAVSMPEISFTPPAEGRAKQFRIVTILNNVTLSVSPEEWMGREEVARLTSMRRSTTTLANLYRFTGPAGANGGRRVGAAARLRSLVTPERVTLKNVQGTYVFTDQGIQVKGVAGNIEGNNVEINGHIDGYRPDAPLALRLTTPGRQNITVPAQPRYVTYLPRQVREVYEQFRPEGQCRIDFSVERREPGTRPDVSGTVQIVDGRFLFSRFPYPLRNVRGELGFGPAASDGTPRIDVAVRGNGPENGPNRDTILEIKTFGNAIGPVGTNICGVNVRISGNDISSEETLRDAFPPEVRQALANFDAMHTGRFPQYHGDFVCEVVRPVGPNQRWGFDTDITLRDASGYLVAFPYPMRNLSGKLLIRSGYAEVRDLKMPHPSGGSLAVSGRVAWTTPDGPRGPQPLYHAPGAILSPRVDEAVTTALDVRVRGLPLDADLLSAIPAERRAWVEKLGATGRIDVDGRVFPGKPVAPVSSGVEWVVHGATTAPSTQPMPQPAPPMTYDLRITMRDGTLKPLGGLFDVKTVNAQLHLTGDRLEIGSATGRRGDATLSSSGVIDWPAGKPHVVLDVAAKSLALDEPLYKLLPASAQQAWDETQARGALDAEVHYDDATPRAGAATRPSGTRVVLKPRKLAATLKSVPYPLEEIAGTITVEGSRVTVDNLTARHGARGKVAVSGTGTVGGSRGVWDLKLAGENLAVDDELRHALPEALAGLVQSVKLEGAVGFDFKKFVYRSGGEPPPPAAAGSGPTTGPVSHPEIDVVGALTFNGAKLDVGVALSDVVGAVNIDAAAREGRLETLRGGIDFTSLKMAGRAAKDFKAELQKPAGETELRIRRMTGQIADGRMSGDMTLVYPEDGPSRYALELVVRDADVRTLAWEKDETAVKGRLTASLSVEGSWGDAGKRRGRGDVMVSGRDMYRIPLVLGLLQVTNLSLPISSPFNEATAVYSLDGNRVIFEQIKLSASNMLMEGNGSLDFDTKKVDLAFTTDNPSGLMQLPFIRDLLKGARNEMLRIQVRGTIQEPEVSAKSMGTFWTTVDKVFKSDNPKKSDGRSSSDKR
jgi:hypothetical protein